MLAPFLFLFLFIVPFVNSQNVSSYETSILLSLKQHWGNPRALASWNSLSSPCEWPEVYCNGRTIAGLYLGGKNLQGTIPSTICQLRNLSEIYLLSNRLSGRIPACLYNCSNLERLDLSMNHLSGTIPGELYRMQRLKTLCLNGNMLSGGIPTPTQAYSLELIDFSNNNLNGSIPDDIRNLPNLQYLGLSMNLLSGSIPRGLFSMQQLMFLYLDNNFLNGSLSHTIWNLYNLEYLDLSYNSLSGPILDDIWNLFSLQYLNLSMNSFSGSIPRGLFRLNQLNYMSLAYNNFSGQMPIELVNKAFDENCLDRSNLCSDNKTLGMPSCPANLCSHSELRPFLNCSRPIAKRIGKAIGGCVLALLILGYLLRKCWKKARPTIATRSNIILPLSFSISDKDPGWEMISFQKLDFNKFDILSSLTEENLIGSGGSGKVYRAIISQTGATVAVKSIWNDKKPEERLVKEFMAEIHTLGSIRHINIVKLLCYISGKNTQLLVYQYFENKSLDQWLHSNKTEILPFYHSSVTRLDWPMRVNIAIGVAQGLCYMHHHCSPPIIHRDIKSSNILLDSEFNAKIADFGLAKMLTTSEDTETASAVVGTFGYIAPEYAYTKRVNVKSDVYSFGAVLLELTTGRKAVMPDDHMNIAEWAQTRYKETSYIVDSLDDEIKESRFLDQIVAVFRLGVTCTIKTPANRPSMRDCLNILQDYSKSFSSSDLVS